MAGIYIHIPFCKQFCSYCDFHSSRSLSPKKELLEALAEEIKLRQPFLGDQPIHTLYIGGGTPSLCTPRELGTLIEQVASLWSDTPLEEVTVEANPDDLSPAYLRALRAEGVNRLSIGIQSLCDEDLRRMNRRHDAATARRAVQDAQDAGFENISIDLIYGLPWSSTNAWQQTVEEALTLNAPHISAYHLTIEEGTLFGRHQREGKLVPVPDEESERQFALLHDRLTAAGYDHYEVSNFARPGFHSQHNSSYWNGAHYLGIGPAAHSYNGDRREWNISNNAQYLKKMAHSGQVQGEQLSDTTRYNEYLMTGLRCSRGIIKSEIERSFGTARLALLLQQTPLFVDEGLLIDYGGRIAIPPERFLLSDRVISALFWVE